MNRWRVPTYCKIIRGDDTGSETSPSLLDMTYGIAILCLTEKNGTLYRMQVLCALCSGVSHSDFVLEYDGRV